MSNARVICILLLLAAISHAQDYSTPYVVHPNQHLRVSLDIPASHSHDANASLEAALATIFQNAEICCGQNSSLRTAASTSASISTSDLAARLGGRHVLSDGRWFEVKAEVIPPSTMNVTQIVLPLLQQHPILMQWNSHWYVLVGADFDETIYDDGRRDYYIHKLVLLDFTNPNAPKQAIFDRHKDDWSKVQGLLVLTATMQ